MASFIDYTRGSEEPNSAIRVLLSGGKRRSLLATKEGP
jgi:hypothetical protein